MFHGLLRSLGVALYCAAIVVAQGPPEPVSDSFEGKQLSSFWTVSQQYGAVTLSPSGAYSGSQSLKFSSTSGGQRNIVATHKVSQLTKGTVSIAFYDAHPGQETLYQYLLLSDSTDANRAVSVGTNDYDAYCYDAQVTTDSGSLGPNANCGNYPQLSTTPVPRTAGWHVFSIHYNSNSVSIAIDGNIIFNTSVDMTFDTIQLVMAGPYWRPNGALFWDNFQLLPPFS